MEPEEMIRWLRPILGDQIDSLWKTYLGSEPEERLLIRHLLENLYDQYVDDYRKEKILLLPPTTLEQLHGQHPLGEVWYTKPLYPFALTEKELTQHIGVFGRTGAGKTYLVKSLLGHIHKPTMVFDWKGSYTETAAILFVPGSSSRPFYFNPLDLKEIAAEHRQTYLRQVIELLIDCYLEDLKLLTVQGVEYLLLLAVHQLADKRFTFHDISKWVDSYNGTYRETDWKTSARNILFKVTTGPLGRILQECDLRLDWLLRKRVVFELNHIGSSKDKSFFIRSLLLRIYYHFESQGPSDHLKLFIAIEEAHNILLRKQGKETIIELMLRQIREFGVGICIIDQHPSLISYPALGTYCTVAFNLRLRQDRDAMASALCLDQTADLGRLPPRYAIVKIQNRFLTPFLIRTHDFHPSPPQAYSEVIRVIRQEEEVIRDLNEVIRASNPVVRVIRQASKRKIFWEEVFLVHIYLHPLMGAVDRYRQLGLNSYQGNKFKDVLLRKKFISLESVSISSGRKKLMVPTKHGFTWMKERGFTTRSDKHGGIEHQYWKRRLRDQFRQREFRVEVEASLPGLQTVDLLIGGKVGIEIETGNNGREQILRNSRKIPVVLFFLRRTTLSLNCPVVFDESQCISEVMRLLGDMDDVCQ